MKACAFATVFWLAALVAPSPMASAGGNPEERASLVDWDAARLAAAQPDAVVAGRFLAARRAALELLRLPLLVPRQEARLSGLDLNARTNLYTARFFEEGAVITITGILTALKPPPGAPRLPASPNPRFERTETGIDIAFSRFGVAYHIAIECKDPDKDRVCGEESFARNLFETLIVILPPQEGAVP